MRSFQPPKLTAAEYMRPREVLIGTGAGLAIGFGAKYIAAGLLILWLLAGGQ